MFVKEDYIAIPLGEYKDFIALETRIEVLVEQIKNGIVDDVFVALEIMGMPETAKECREAHEQRMKELEEDLRKWKEEKLKQEAEERLKQEADENDAVDGQSGDGC